MLTKPYPSEESLFPPPEVGYDSEPDITPPEDEPTPIETEAAPDLGAHDLLITGDNLHSAEVITYIQNYVVEHWGGSLEDWEVEITGYDGRNEMHFNEDKTDLIDTKSNTPVLAEITKFYIDRDPSKIDAFKALLQDYRNSPNTFFGKEKFTDDKKNIEYINLNICDAEGRVSSIKVNYVGKKEEVEEREDEFFEDVNDEQDDLQAWGLNTESDGYGESPDSEVAPVEVIAEEEEQNADELVGQSLVELFEGADGVSEEERLSGSIVDQLAEAFGYHYGEEIFQPTVIEGNIVATRVQQQAEPQRTFVPEVSVVEMPRTTFYGERKSQISETLEAEIVSRIEADLAINNLVVESLPAIVSPEPIKLIFYEEEPVEAEQTLQISEVSFDKTAIKTDLAMVTKDLEIIEGVTNANSNTDESVAMSDEKSQSYEVIYPVQKSDTKTPEIIIGLQSSEMTAEDTARQEKPTEVVSAISSAEVTRGMSKLPEITSIQKDRNVKLPGKSETVTEVRRTPTAPPSERQDAGMFVPEFQKEITRISTEKNDIRKVLDVPLQQPMRKETAITRLIDRLGGGQTRAQFGDDSVAANDNSVEIISHNGITMQRKAS